jgi:8-oxo-dGTP pyrophosphatase MutT (NUDIX family)
VRIRRLLISRFGGLYNDIIGRRTHLGVAAVIFDEQGRVLLVRHSYGRRGWELPGGGRRGKESLEEAVRREVREETGLEVATAHLRGIYFEPDVDQHQFAFLCRLVEAAEPRASSPEILECRYCSLAALPRPMTGFTLERINDAQSSEESISIKVMNERRWLG